MANSVTSVCLGGNLIVCFTLLLTCSGKQTEFFGGKCSPDQNTHRWASAPAPGGRGSRAQTLLCGSVRPARLIHRVISGAGGAQLCQALAGA